MTHPSHKTRISIDASSYDEICDLCGATDGSEKGLIALSLPCEGNDGYMVSVNGRDLKDLLDAVENIRDIWHHAGEHGLQNDDEIYAELLTRCLKLLGKDLKIKNSLLK